MMRLSIACIALTAALLAGCGAPADNKPANTNTNTNTSAKTAAPTLEQLVALDKQATEAWTKSDGNFFNGLLADKFFMVMDGKRMGKAEMIKMVNETKCDMKSSQSAEHQMSRIDDDTYVLTSKGTFDGTCMGQKVPSPVRAASVFVRNGDKWQALYHNETPILEPKAGAAEKTETNSDTKKPDVKRNDQKAAGDKAADGGMTGNKAGKTGAEMAESVQTQSDAITNALTTVETWGWEAWRLKDAKKLDEITASDAAFVNPMGGIAATRAEVMKMLTEGNCQVTSTKISDNAGSLITDKLAFLTYKGTAAGTCGGEKLVPVWGTTFFVKVGESWKAAFMFESPA